MPADWILIGTLGVTSFIVISSWGMVLWYGYQWPQMRGLFQRGVAGLPPALQQRLVQFAQHQAIDQTAAGWLQQRVFLALFIAPFVLLPLPLLYKLALLLVLLLRWLSAKQRQRRYLQRVLSQWPSTLDMLSMLIQAGLSLPAALHALHGTSNHLASMAELGHLHRLQQSGATLTEALQVLTQRIPHAWISLFAGAVLQAQHTGGALAQTLRSQAEQCRQQQLLAAEKRAQEVAVKLMLPLIFCFFPVTMLLILGPILIRFATGGEW